MAEKDPRHPEGGAAGRMILLAEEQRVEGNRFSECHADDGLHENWGCGTGIASDGFGGFEADKAHADCGAEAAETALDASCDFSDNLDHDGWYFVGWMAAVRTLGTVPAGKCRELMGCFLVFAAAGLVVMAIAVVAN